ncbi:MAG TPA: hypothetical protein VFE92_08970 [Dermatophilaceae bacterium]|nr:hypothetical protein [Dermatophilaceae bacterium]
MSRWPRGETQIEQLIANKQLQRVIGGQANGAHLLQKASRTLESAGGIAEQDPDSAYVLAYDAARHAGTAILAHQACAQRQPAGIMAVEVDLRAQFGEGLRPFGAMRRRRNELEYPTGPGETTTHDEAQKAIQDSSALLRAAQQLLPTLFIF